MTNELRATGIDVIGNIPWGEHFCTFYETKPDLLDILVPYFKSGLESNEFCLWVVAEPLTENDAIDALQQAIPDALQHLEAGHVVIDSPASPTEPAGKKRDPKGRIEIVSHTEWYLNQGTFGVERIIDKCKALLADAVADGYAGLRVNGNESWLKKEDWEDFLKYEENLNEIIVGRRMIALCTYPLDTSGAAKIFDVAHAHHFAIARRRGEWQVIETPELLQAKAEITRLTEALHRAGSGTRRHSRILRYGAAVAAITVATIIAVSMQMMLGRESTPIVALFLGAVMFSAWFGGVGPGLFAVALSTLSFGYFFVMTTHSLIVDFKEIPRLIIFVLAALFVGSLSAAQRRSAESLRRARDVLDGTVQMLKRTNEALQMENSERRSAEVRLKATSEQLRLLSASLESAREDEGTRIAREIHDELGSALTSLKWDLESFDRSISGSGEHAQLEELRPRIGAMLKLTESTIGSVRRISSELRPTVLDDLGLAAAIEWEAEQFQTRTGISCRCDCSIENLELSREQSTSVFRILQEALTNILRHSQATSVEITINERAGELVLEITDNGRGITSRERSASRSLGLLGMQERAHLIGGSCIITGVEGKGTAVIVSVPIPGPEDA